MSRTLAGFDRLGLEVPLVQAPIGSATCPELTAAVSDGGALGMLALSWHTILGARAAIAETRRRTSRPFGVNLVLAWNQDARLRACLDAGVEIVSTFWGDPGPVVPIVHGHSALHIHTVGSAVEAERAADAGVDVIVAQGVEAGGHVRGEASLGELLPSVLGVVGPVPVIAAGGITTGSEAAGWLARGAAAVWVGTRFLCSPEARVHPAYRAAILASREGDTFLGTVFTEGWPGAPHRVLRNSTVERWLRDGSPHRGWRPGEGDAVATSPDGHTIRRYEDVIPLRGSTGDVEALALYAGTGAARISTVQPAREIVEEFRGALASGSLRQPTESWLP